MTDKSATGYEEKPTSTLSTQVAVHLMGLGYTAARSDGGSRYLTRIQTRVGEYRDAQLLVHEEERVIRIYVRIPRPCVSSRESWISALVNIANDELAIFGFFAIDAAGQLYHHVAEEFESGIVSQEQLDRMLNRTAFPLKVLERALSHFSKGKTSPLDALRAALTVHQALDVDDQGASVRKAMLLLV